MGFLDRLRDVAQSVGRRGGRGSGGDSTTERRNVGGRVAGLLSRRGRGRRGGRDGQDNTGGENERNVGG